MDGNVSILDLRPLIDHSVKSCANKFIWTTQKTDIFSAIELHSQTTRRIISKLNLSKAKDFDGSLNRIIPFPANVSNKFIAEWSPWEQIDLNSTILYYFSLTGGIQNTLVLIGSSSWKFVTCSSVSSGNGEFDFRAYANPFSLLGWLLMLSSLLAFTGNIQGLLWLPKLCIIYLNNFSFHIGCYKDSPKTGDQLADNFPPFSMYYFKSF